MSDKRQKIQLRLAFDKEGRSEASMAPGGGSETLTAKRYADDCNIYVRSCAAGERVKQSIICFITRRLRLKVNEQKSAVARPADRMFLGFSLTRAREAKRRIAAKAIVRFKQKVRELTGRTRGDQYRANDEGAVQLLTRLEELLRLLRDALGAHATGSMDTTQAAIRDLEAMEMRQTMMCGTASGGGVG